MKASKNTLKFVSDNATIEQLVTGTAQSAGYDLAFAYDFSIAPGAELMVGSGIKVKIPEGFFGMIVPRSSTGSAFKPEKSLQLVNTVGIIDSDYRGEIKFNLRNVGKTTFLGYAGDRLFQLILVPYSKLEIELVESLDNTERGDGGFGSTDTKG